MVQLDTSTSARAVDVALTKSVAFAYLEILWKHFVSAYGHIKSGMRILAELARWRKRTPEHHLPRELLIQMDLRLDTQVMDFGRSGFQAPPVFEVSPLQTLLPSFAGAEEAKSCIELLRYQTLHFVRHAEYARNRTVTSGPFTPEILKRHLSLRQQPKHYSVSFINLTLEKNTRNCGIASSNLLTVTVEIIRLMQRQPV